MLRDITMIVSVLVSVLSLGFGVYKNIEAGNAKSFAYEQAYQVMNVVKTASIDATAKANILASALGVLRMPPPVIDFSQSSAAPVEMQICTAEVRSTCVDLAGTLATQNAQCVQSKGVGAACAQATQTKAQISAQKCITCFTQ